MNQSKSSIAEKKMVILKKELLMLKLAKSLICPI